MARNLVFDLETLLPSLDLLEAKVVEDASGGHFLHCLVGDTPAVPDWGTRHPQAYEHTRDIPARFRQANGEPRHQFLGVPFRDAPPEEPAP